jgi:hypothetical protein
VRQTFLQLAAVLMATPALLYAEPPGAPHIGVYYWGGKYPRSVSRGVNAVAGLGGRIVRLALSANFDRDYNMSAACHPEFSLAAAAQDPDVKSALDNPAIDVFILTAYDGVTWGDCQRRNFVDPAFFTPARTASIIQEYSDLTLYLYRTYQHTHKRFVISNWESDNSIYCGQAYAFATDPAFRAMCLSEYPSLLGVASPREALQGLTLWFKARAQGIVEGRSRAQAENIGGMRVYMAPEFNVVRALHDAGFQSVLYDVLPFVMFDYVSYSAWESINRADAATTLWADLNTIQDVVGSSAIIVGESGYVRDANNTEVPRTNEVISTALAWGVSYFIQWELYDSDASNEFGLYDMEGQPTPLAAWFRQFFQQDAPETPFPRRKSTASATLEPSPATAPLNPIH